MNAGEAIAALQGLNVRAFTTADAAALFRESTTSASWTLRRLANAGVLFSICHGVWTFEPHLDPFALTDILTAPAPSYVSLHTALYRRGVIEQIPSAIYVVTLGKARVVTTTVGSFSLHKIPPELFGGFETLERGGRLATAEKALVDFLYLSSTRNRVFARLPEIELPRGFDRKKVLKWIAAIPSARHQTIARRRFTQWVEPHFSEQGTS